MKAPVSHRRRLEFCCPQAGQEGTRYDVCFQGVDGNDMKSQKKCFSINVLAAVISWAQTTPCPNPVVDAEDVLVCPPDGHHVTITVGCHYTYSLAAVAERYSLHLREQQYPSCDGCALLEPHGHTHNQKTTENLLVTQCSQKSGAEAAVACCGNGICDGLETGGACTSDCQLDTASLTQTQVGSNANGWLSRAEYTWTPMWGTEGRRLLKRFEGVTSAGESSSNMLSNRVVDGQRTRTHAPSFCVVFDVQRCSYCIPHKATMKSLSAHYFLNAVCASVCVHILCNVCARSCVCVCVWRSRARARVFSHHEYDLDEE